MQHVLHTAFQIDAPHSLNPRTDTSIALMEEAQARGLAVWCYHPSQLSLITSDASKSGFEVRAPMQRITIDVAQRKAGAPDWFSLGEVEHKRLNEFHSIWLRQDPPFDMSYITSTHLLEMSGTRVFNNPAGVRNAPEKLSPFAFAQFMPPTLVSADESAIHAFAATHKKLVAKPLYGFGGRSVFKFETGDSNLNTFLEFWRESSREPLMWQAFLPEVTTGDRRIILINGEVASCFGRTPESGSIRANMRVGGTPVAATLTPRQTEIATAVGAFAKAQGLLIVGLDVIGDYVTEINVTCPTGFRAAEWLYGENLAKQTWDAATKIA